MIAATFLMVSTIKIVLAYSGCIQGQGFKICLDFWILNCLLKFLQTVILQKITSYLLRNNLGVYLFSVETFFELHLVREMRINYFIASLVALQLSTKNKTKTDFIFFFGMKHFAFYLLFRFQGLHLFKQNLLTNQSLLSSLQQSHGWSFSDGSVFVFNISVLKKKNLT